MEEWRKIAIAEVNELAYLLNEGPSFTPADLCDRLHGLLEYMQLDPTKEPINEDCDSSDTPTAADPAVRGTSPEGKGVKPESVVYAQGQE